MTKPNTSGGGGGGGSRPSRAGGKKALRRVGAGAGRGLKQPDNSVLRPPLETSVAGLRQAVRLFETSTPEVVHLMSYECDIIYECRVCRNLFRSVANFISHKRIYCTRRFNHVQNSQVVEDHTLLVDGVGAGRGGDHQGAPTRITARQDLTTIVQQASMAQFYRDAEDKVAQREQTRFDTTVHLQPIDNTTYGVYQTYETPGAKNPGSLMKDQVSELQNIMLMKEGVTLGPDGKILATPPSRIPPQSPQMPETPVHHSNNSKHSSSSKNEEHILSHNENVCGLCKIKFSSKKTLSHHTRNVHGSFRVAYTCPCCTNLFTNTWSVMRHLARVHRKTNDQVRRLRSQIQKKQVHAEKLIKKPGEASKSSPPSNKRLVATPDKSEWAGEVVKKGSGGGGAEVLRCAGCRRQFERQAAFHSHTQICHKRIALLDQKNKMAATPKPHGNSEKRIGIQVRMNYCKSATASPSPSPVATAAAAAGTGTTSPKSRRSDRHKNDSCDRSSLSLQLPGAANATPPPAAGSRQSSRERSTPDPLTLNGPKSSSLNGSAPTAATTLRGKIDSKLKAKKIESISRLLMAAIGSREESANCLPPAINGVKHCAADDDDNNTVPKSNDAGDKCSRSSRASSCSAVVVVGGDSDKGSVERASRLSSRTRTVRLSSVDANASVSSSKEADVKSNSCGPLVVEVNGVHVKEEGEAGEGEVGDEEHGQLSPSKEGVIRVLTRYQLKSICKKDEEEIVVVGDVVGEGEGRSAVPEPEEVDRLREMFRSNIHYKTLQCLVCHEKMMNIIDLKNHVADHFGCNHFRCTFAQCSFVTYARGECIRHLMRAHLKQRERHLAPGYIARVAQNGGGADHSASARRKRSVPLKKDVAAAAAAAKSGNTVKRESVAEETAADGETKAKSAKRRKLASADDVLPPPSTPTTTTITGAGPLSSAADPDLNESAQSQTVAGGGGEGKESGPGEVPGHSSVSVSDSGSGSEKVEMTAPSASESDEDTTQQPQLTTSSGEETAVTWRDSLRRSFRGFDVCAKDQVGLTELPPPPSCTDDNQDHSLSVGDNCNIRTMVMNVIFGPDHSPSTTK